MKQPRILATPSLLLLATLAGVASPAAAAWSASPGALVTPAAAMRLPQLAIPDGEGGMFLVLGGPSGGGTGVFVQHVNAAGDVAAGWPAAGADVCPAAAVQGEGCLPYHVDQPSAATDGAGGVYVSWAGPPFAAGANEPTVYVQHIAASGARAAGWPASGLPVTTGAGQASSVAYPDGNDGVFVLWRDVRHLFPPTSTADDPHIMLQHVRADGAIAPGSTALGRFLGSGVPPVHEPRLDASFVAEPTGGAWAIVERASADTTVEAAGFIVMRFDLSGAVANGWGEDGVRLPGPSADVGHPSTRAAHLFGDGSGGAWAFVASGARGSVIAFHLLGDGAFDPALPATGLTLAAATGEIVEPDGAGGFLVHVVTDSGALALRRLLPDGAPDPAWSPPIKLCGGLDATLFPTADGVLGVGWLGLSSQACQTLSGEALVGRLDRDGSIPADWPAGGAFAHGVAAAVNTATTTTEMSTVSCADGPGSFLVAWRVLGGDAPAAAGEVRAIRFTLQGAVTGVEPGGGGRLRAWWTRDGGVHATLAASTGARQLDVCDLAGRRVTSAVVPAGASEATVAGTRALSPGIYFLQLRAPGGAERAKVLVTR